MNAFQFMLYIYTYMCVCVCVLLRAVAVRMQVVNSINCGFYIFCFPLNLTDPFPRTSPKMIMI